MNLKKTFKSNVSVLHYCPKLPKVEMLALTGKAVEGDVLTAVEVIPNTGLD